MFKIAKGLFIQLIGTPNADVGIIPKVRIMMNDGAKHFLTFPTFNVASEDAQTWHEISMKTTFDTSGKLNH